MKNLKTEKGITLIALVITIIVLLILVAVALNMLIGENGLIKNAKLASKETKAANIEEMKNMWEIERVRAKETGKEGKSLEDFLEELEEEGLLTEEQVNTIKTSENKEITIGDKTISFDIEEETLKITLSETSGEIEVESTLVLTATLNITAEEDIVWTSSDNSIATVVGSGTNNSTGTITGLKAGTVPITATYDNKTATCIITIIEKPKYTVTFYDEDKTTILDTVIVEKGETATYTGNIPTKSSKVFRYWVTENDTKANLENITENLNVYAYYTSSVCFVAGTKVLTEEGLINIEDIQIGTKVYSMNEETGEIELKLVKNTFKNIVDKNMCKVYINGEVIESTSGHPYYEVNKGWIKASELEKGDTLLKKDGNKIIVDELQIIEFNGNLNTVYNIEVEDNHNYFVGENSVLVHNHAGGGNC